MFSVLRLCFLNFWKIDFIGESPQILLCSQVRENGGLAKDWWREELEDGENRSFALGSGVAFRILAESLSAPEPLPRYHL